MSNKCKNYPDCKYGAESNGYCFFCNQEGEQSDANMFT